MMTAPQHKPGELTHKVYVSWDNIKAIYKRVCDLSAIRAQQTEAEHAPATGEAP